MATIPESGEADARTRQRVAGLLERWQSGHDPDDFDALLTVVREPLERLAARTLRQSGIRDPGACDEAVALVLEQLCRLGIDPDAAAAGFDRNRLGTSPGDPGWAYVRCMGRSRARDVARGLRRRDRCAADYAARTTASRSGRDHEAADAEAGLAELRSALDSLDERSRQVFGLLLDGKSQAVIAHMLGVCEGTVSRIRTRAIARLRSLLVGRTGGS